MKLGLGAASIVTLGATSSAEAAKPKTPFQLEPTYIPIANSSEQFPVRRIYCIGRNYAAHAREMGSDPTREPPFFFQKPTDAIQFVAPNKIVDHPYPTLTKNYHYEVELVAALKTGGKNITIDKALDHVYGYALGLDMTRRDLQRFMGDQKKPWEIGKSFDHSAPIGPIFPVSKIGHQKSGS
ncbi:MAG: FAA hydrolase family protein, partial [Burkholderiaceae bacterium]|nr:FAA hydrolase family protein [Burkholderiaceae bacterium]